MLVIFWTLHLITDSTCIYLLLFTLQELYGYSHGKKKLIRPAPVSFHSTGQIQRTYVQTSKTVSVSIMKKANTEE